MADLTGRTLLNRYRIEEAIGRGGMAEVYRAWDAQRNYHVALKLLRADLAEDREFDRRFRREGQALAALAHRNIVRFYSFERQGHLAFIVMDYVEGITLRRRIFDADGPMPLDEALSVVRQVVSALHYAHAQGVLHRDVKPGNIMIEPDGLVLLSDFGIAKAAGMATMTTVMPGTPAYMSPEQCRNEELDERTDVYSLGVVAYEMLTGRRPFIGESEEAGTGSTGERIRREQMMCDPPQPRRFNPALPRGVEEVVLKALAKGREERWSTPLAFWRALERAAQGPEPKVDTEAETVLPKRPAEELAQPAAEARTPEPAPMPAVRAAEAVEAAEPMEKRAHSVGRGRPPAPPAPASVLQQLPGWAWGVGGLALVLLVIGLLGGEWRQPTVEVVERVVTATPGERRESTEPVPEATAAPPTKTPRPTEPPAGPAVGDTWTRPSDDTVMVYVPAGEFEMGSTDGDSDEKPVHTVALDGFWIDQTEVTNAQYQLCVADGDCDASRYADDADFNGDDYPVVGVDWYDAQAYCESAGARLPTEAEWEYAARGPEGNTYPWGNDDPTCQLAQYGGCSGRTVPVGSLPDGASWCGGLDMAGNVWEWVADWYGDYPAGRQVNPTGPSSGEYRVLRGGSWISFADYVRCAVRIRNTPDYWSGKLGLRCARGSD